MGSSDEVPAGRHWLVDVARTIVLQLLIGVVLAGAAGIAWSWRTGWATPQMTIGAAIMYGGVIWMLTGGTLFPKMLEMESMQWGVHNRPGRVADDRELFPNTVQLTPLGSALIVGTLLVLAGTLLQL